MIPAITRSASSFLKALSKNKVAMSGAVFNISGSFGTTHSWEKTISTFLRHIKEKNPTYATLTKTNRVPTSDTADITVLANFFFGRETSLRICGLIVRSEL